MTTFRPLYDQILIRPDDPAEKIGSIWIPDSAREIAMQGTVVAAGKGICNHRHGGWTLLAVRPADRVLFGSRHMQSNELLIEGKKHIVVRQDDLAAILDADGAIRPLFDRIIVKREPEIETSPGGIIIPDTAKQKAIEGTVLAVGTGQIMESGTVRRFDLKVGDRVLFGRYAGTEVKLGGEERVILREDDVLGVREPEAAAESAA